MSKTPPQDDLRFNIDLAGGSLPDTRSRQGESPSDGSIQNSLPATPDIPALLRRLEHPPEWHDDIAALLREARAALAKQQREIDGLSKDYGRLLTESNGYEAQLREAEARVPSHPFGGHAVIREQCTSCGNPYVDWSSSSHMRCGECRCRAARDEALAQRWEAKAALQSLNSRAEVYRECAVALRALRSAGGAGEGKP